MTQTKRDKMIARIREIQADLAALNVKPEKVNLSKLTDDEIAEFGISLAAQLETRKIFLRRK